MLFILVSREDLAKGYPEGRKPQDMHPIVYKLTNYIHRAVSSIPV